MKKTFLCFSLLSCVCLINGLSAVQGKQHSNTNATQNKQHWFLNGRRTPEQQSFLLNAYAQHIDADDNREQLTTILEQSPQGDRVERIAWLEDRGHSKALKRLHDEANKSKTSKELRETLQMWQDTQPSRNWIKELVAQGCTANAAQFIHFHKEDQKPALQIKCLEETLKLAKEHQQRQIKKDLKKMREMMSDNDVDSDETDSDDVSSDNDETNPVNIDSNESDSDDVSSDESDAN